jgi:predicted ester cyclase
VIDAISRDDPAVLNRFLAEDLIDHNPIPGQSAGRMGFKEWMASARISFPDLRGSVETVLPASGNHVVGRVTQHGPFAGLPPTHKPVALAVIHIVRFEKDLIVEWWGMADLLGAVHSLGAKLCWNKRM